MLRLKGLFGGLFLALLLALGCGASFALTPEQAVRIAEGDSDDRIVALNEVVAAGDPALVPFVQALLADEVRWQEAGPTSSRTATPRRRSTR
jgi:hypothetical protein